MKGRVFVIFAVLSLLVCLAVVGMWVRSYWITDQVTWVRAVGSGAEVSVRNRGIAGRQGSVLVGRSSTTYAFQSKTDAQRILLATPSDVSRIAMPLVSTSSVSLGPWPQGWWSVFGYREDSGPKEKMPLSLVAGAWMVPTTSVSSFAEWLSVPY